MPSLSLARMTIDSLWTSNPTECVLFIACLDMLQMLDKFSVSSRQGIAHENPKSTPLRFKITH